MKAEVIEIRDVDDISTIQKVASLLDEGALVAIPTDTVYGIGCRVCKESIDHLNQVKNRDVSKHYTLHVGSPEQLGRYVPNMSLRAKKLVQRGLPGPLTIVFQLEDVSLKSIRDNLTIEVSDLLYSDRTVGIRYPDHPVICQVLSSAAAPIVAPSANPADQAPALTAQQVIDYFSDSIDYIVSVPDFERKHSISSTIVKVDNKGFEILREGIVPKDIIRKWTSIQILFVCTGNTCRSPMAEGIFRGYLANILHCSVDELENIGYIIKSAGTAAFDDIPASQESVIVCRENGIDIGQHLSQLVDQELLDESDLIFTMTEDHYQQVIMIDPGAEIKTEKLSSNCDIQDPVGLGVDVYRQCFNEIQEAVVKRVKEIL